MTLVGESLGAVLALTTAADLPERVRCVVAVNPYDYRDGIARSSALARVVIGGALMPGVGPVVAGVEPKPVLRRILQGGVGDKTAVREDYLDELQNLPSQPAADFTQVPEAGHFISLERPETVADLLTSVA
ncbi:hypothetical protein SNL152K_1434 [Streptomyces sp. NL15-2K]|nr:alpha/beta hydrolase [Kutzneria buriramensis]WKX14706.1 alpha/beta hydrolase [Kutzneria buriramensis]GCB44149.1 hypothetical protein SNL152K_1434 [Streptomyces sp. NL15-2K]